MILLWAWLGAHAGEVERACACEAFGDSCLDTEDQVRDPRVLAVIVRDAELHEALEPELVRELRRLDFDEILVDQELSRWIRFHRDRADRLAGYRQVRQVRLGSDASDALATVRQREAYDRCIARLYASRLQEQDDASRDRLEVRLTGDRQVLLRRATTPDAATATAVFSLEAWRTHSPGALRRAVLSVFPETDRPPAFGLTVTQPSLHGGRPTPCTDDGLTVLAHEPLVVAPHALVDEEDLADLTPRWTIDGRGVRSEDGALTLVPGEDLEDAPVVTLSLSDANNAPEQRSCTLDVRPAADLRARHPPLQIVGGRPTGGVLGGRARFWPSLAGRVQVLSPVQLRVALADDADDAEVVYTWRQIDGPRVRCDAVRAVTCTPGDNLVAVTHDPLLALSTTQAGRYAFEVVAERDGLPSQVLTTEAFAANHRSTIADGMQPEVFGGIAAIGTAVVPFLGGSVRTFPGLHLRSFLAPEPLPEALRLWVGVGAELDLVDALAGLIDRPQERNAPRAFASLAHRFDLDWVVIADLNSLAIGEDGSSPRPPRSFLSLNSGPQLRLGGWTLTATSFFIPPIGDLRTPTSQLDGPRFGWAVQTAFRFRTTPSVNAQWSWSWQLPTAHREYLARQEEFHCWRTWRNRTRTMLRCRARADDLHPLRAVGYWAAPLRTMSTGLRASHERTADTLVVRVQQDGRWLGRKGEVRVDARTQAAVLERLREELQVVFPRLTVMTGELPDPATDAVAITAEPPRGVVVTVRGDFLDPEASDQRWCGSRRGATISRDRRIAWELGLSLCDFRLDRTIAEAVLDAHAAFLHDPGPQP